MTPGWTIAVGVGCGATGWQPLAWSVAEASASSGRIVVCHVCRPGTRPADLSLPALELVDPALSRAVAAARNRLGAHRVALSVHTVLVVGVPRRPGWAERASTTHYVVRHATVPVVVVRPVFDGRQGPFAGHIVVGVDSSPPARAALELGFALAAAHRRPLAAVYVTARDHEDLWFDDIMLETHHVAEPSGLPLLAGQVEPWHHRYPTVAVKRALYGGRPLPGLLRAADGAYVLVVGDQGAGPAARALLGSVSHGAVDRACCPVAVAHTRSTAATAAARMAEVAS